MGMVEWLARLFRNHRVIGTAFAGTITHDAYSCEKRMNEIAHLFMNLSTRLRYSDKGTEMLVYRVIIFLICKGII